MNATQIRRRWPTTRSGGGDGEQPMDAGGSPPPLRAPRWLVGWLDQIEADERIDRLATPVNKVSDVIATGRRAEVLGGEWLGHALHPLAVDLPIGFFTSANLLDLVGGRRGQPAARRLVGLGLATTPLAVASGLVEYSTIRDERPTRVAVVHALGNSAAAGLYLMSYLARRRGLGLRGRLFGLAGSAVATGTGYLGGHLAYNWGIGQGNRGLGRPGRPDADAILLGHEGPPPEAPVRQPPVVGDVAGSSLISSGGPAETSGLIASGGPAATSGLIASGGPAAVSGLISSGGPAATSGLIASGRPAETATASPSAGAGPNGAPETAGEVGAEGRSEPAAERLVPGMGSGPAGGGSVSRQEAAALLEVTEDRIDVMVEEGMLVPVPDTGTAPGATRFDRASVDAVRLLGG